MYSNKAVFHSQTARVWGQIYSGEQGLATEAQRTRGGKKKQREPRVWPGDAVGMPLMQRNKSFKGFCPEIASDLSKEWKQTWYLQDRERNCS